MKKTIAYIIFCFLFVTIPLFSENSVDGQSIKNKLGSVLDSSIADELLSNSKIRRISYGKKDVKLDICPSTKIANMTTSGWKNGNPVFMVENLYLYKKSNLNNVKNISDILHSVSKLEGIQYYSTSRKKMRTLYKTSYAVKSSENEKGKFIYEKITDQLDATTMLVLQEDLTFGRYIYKYTYKKADDGVGFYCENTEKLKYSVFKIMDPYEMNIALSVTHFDDYLLVYVNTRANFVKLSSLKKKLENSFSTRADAIYNWFISEYECK